MGKVESHSPTRCGLMRSGYELIHRVWETGIGRHKGNVDVGGGREINNNTGHLFIRPADDWIIYDRAP